MPQFESAKQKFQELYFKIIQSVIREINERCNDGTLELVLSIAKIIKGYESENDIQIIKELNYYNKMVDFNILTKEVLSWKHCLKKFKYNININLNSVLSIAELIRKEKLGKDFPQIKNLMRIYLAIPATSAAAERAFSVLKRIKTWLRNSIGQDRLSSLSMISIEKGLSKEIDIDKVIDQFAAGKDGRMQLF